MVLLKNQKMFFYLFKLYIILLIISSLIITFFLKSVCHIFLTLAYNIWKKDYQLIYCYNCLRYFYLYLR